MAYSHLQDLVGLIPPIDDDADILLLIGRDLIDAHYVLDQRTGHRSPYAQKLSLGWVVIGESCLSRAHAPETIVANKTYLLDNGRPSLMDPCSSFFNVKDRCSKELQGTDSVFCKTVNDDKPGLSIEDRDFLIMMDRDIQRTSEGRWMAPLPFRNQRRTLPNNKQMALKRATALRYSLNKNPTKCNHFTEFMQGILDNGYAEIAPPLLPGEECWYVPIFGVYHPKKPNKLRVVFDSSAKYDDICLNDVLLSGPDSANDLLGVLLRFRKESVAITADIEQMFFRFVVPPYHRNFLRFLWHQDNDVTQELVDFRMWVHIFGNSSSPAVATYGLRKSVEDAENDVHYFVNRNFYVDDGLISVPSVEEGGGLVKRTQEKLLESGLKLNKIASNNKHILLSIKSEDRSKELEAVDLSMGQLPMQRTLGMLWNLQTDVFTFCVKTQEKPFTRRGVLSTLHSIYVPFGIVAPAILPGRMLFRNLVEVSYGWEDPLSLSMVNTWRAWCKEIQDLSGLEIPRMYGSYGLSGSACNEIHIFSDASEKAISCVGYLKTTGPGNDIQIGFLLGKSKISPKHGHTVPRLELCAAVMAAEISDFIVSHIDAPIDSVTFHTDSRIVLGYINNQTRRFFTYVSNRVSRILKVSRPSQWKYVSTDQNPADIGTRGISSKSLQRSVWLQPPPGVLCKSNDNVEYELVEADSDAEVRSISCLKTDTQVTLGVDRFSRFSKWSSLVSGILYLVQFVRRKKGIPSNEPSTMDVQSVESFIIRSVQLEKFPNEYRALQNKDAVPKQSDLSSLNPFMDSNGLLRVGGRLGHSCLDENEKHPLIIPKRSHLATLLIRRYHEKVHHQGRHLPEGCIRAAGFWILGMKRHVSSIIYNCVICRRLRGKSETQILAELPSDRLKPTHLSVM